MEMVKISDFVILHLLQMLSGILADWLGQFFHEVRLVDLHILQHLIDVLLYGEQVSLDPFLFKEFDLGSLVSLIQAWSR